MSSAVESLTTTGMVFSSFTVTANGATVADDWRRETLLFDFGCVPASLSLAMSSNSMFLFDTHRFPIANDYVYCESIQINE
jgi:hypothetical protein